MEKSWWKSLTIWSAVLYAVTVGVSQLTGNSPDQLISKVGQVADAIQPFLVVSGAVGLRRAIGKFIKEK